MTTLPQYVSLKTYNTFGLDIHARFFAEISSVQEFRAIRSDELYRNMPLLILGGGSNVLLTKDFQGLCLLNRLKGKTIIEEDQERVKLKIASGENWHELVMYCVERGWGGIENLSLIPGTVGAAPMQNIGAYGVEIKEVLNEVEFINLDDLETKTLDNIGCRFGYRDSIFKQELKGKVFITAVTITLLKNARVNISYGAISQILNERGISNPTIKDVSDAVIYIRQSKLPDPAELGNAGSFFKNPEIPSEQYALLKEKYPEAPGYPLTDGRIKVPAGWLIETAGWKGKRVGNTGCHVKQALVIVNYGGASGEEITEHAYRIIDDVREKFGMELSPEVNLV